METENVSSTALELPLTEFKLVRAEEVEEEQHEKPHGPSQVPVPPVPQLLPARPQTTLLTSFPYVRVLPQTCGCGNTGHKPLARKHPTVLKSQRWKHLQYPGNPTSHLGFYKSNAQEHCRLGRAAWILLPVPLPTVVTLPTPMEKQT